MAINVSSAANSTARLRCTAGVTLFAATTSIDFSAVTRLKPPMRTNQTRLAFWLFHVLAMTALPGLSLADSGPFGFDRRWSRDDRGIYSRTNQRLVEYGVLGLEAAGALALGNDDRVGHVFWQAIDSTAVAGLASLAMKKAFSRARPDQGNDPNRWFEGSCCESFPSGEVTLQASVITPFVVHEAKDHPWIWALELLPAYDAVARLKSQEHWPSDVLVGWALGTVVGYWSTTRETPLSVLILPRGVSVGFTRRF